MKNIFSILLLLMLISCKESIEKTGVLQSSYNIENSKKNGVFITSFKPIKSSNDSAPIIDEVWIEYLWWYKDIGRNIEKETQKSAYINLKSTYLDVSDFELLYGLNLDNKGGVMSNKLTFKVDEIPDDLKLAIVEKNKDTMIFQFRRIKE